MHVTHILGGKLNEERQSSGSCMSSTENVFVEKCWTPSNQTNKRGFRISGARNWKDVFMGRNWRSEIYVWILLLLSCTVHCSEAYPVYWPLLSSSWFTFNLKKKKKRTEACFRVAPPPTYTFKAHASTGTRIQPLAIVKHCDAVECASFAFVSV